MSNNKIEAKDKTVRELLQDQKYFIDYFQREYRWEKRHMAKLIEDLSQAFVVSYTLGDEREKVSKYKNYYLGPVVLNDSTDGKDSIVDGQQRLTSITLLLIYLNHRQSDLPSKTTIENLIYSERYGKKSFNMSDPSREECLNALFTSNDYQNKPTDNETIVNMAERYRDIQETFPDEIDGTALPYFIDWLLDNVIFVRIVAHNEEDAYSIFETMNDRGMSLTQTEMLKGFVLSKITDTTQRNTINDLWKIHIQKLHELDKNADIDFFQAWFRGKYAESIRPGKVDSENQDFEILGTKFHNWFKDNCESKFNLKTSKDFYEFFNNQFPFFVELYREIISAKSKLDDNMTNLFYVGVWGIADSLLHPLLLSSVVHGDDKVTIHNKLNFTSAFIETFTVRRSVNYKNFSQSSIKYTMFNLIKGIRNKPLDELAESLKFELSNMEYTFDGIDNFRLHGMNKRFVKHLLSRITAYVDSLAGIPGNYSKYMFTQGKGVRPFEIEHIWSDHFEEHNDEFDQKSDFEDWRNSIGAMILLPNGTNQSHGDDSYQSKVKYYLRENLYAQSLNAECYEKNPNFKDNETIKRLGFKPHGDFKKDDITDRKALVKAICQEIWSSSNFDIKE